MSFNYLKNKLRYKLYALQLYLLERIQYNATGGIHNTSWDNIA